MINQNTFFFRLNEEFSLWPLIKQDAGVDNRTSATTIAAFAVGILSSAYLAYKKPSNWWLTFLTVEIISFSTLSKCLYSGNFIIIKSALATHLAIGGCLSLGGLGAACLSIGKFLLSSFKANQFFSTLIQVACLAKMLEYAIPFFQNYLKRSYHILHNSEMQERLTVLYQYLLRQPAPQICSLWHDAVLQLTLFEPDFVLNVSQILKEPLSDASLLIAWTVSETNYMEKFHQTLNNLENSEDLLSEELLSDQMAANYCFGLQIALQFLQGNHLTLALEELIMRAPKIIVSHEKFLQLFQGNVLEEMNRLIQTFISLMNNWGNAKKEYEELIRDTFQLQDEIKDLSLKQLQEKKDYFQQYCDNLYEKYCTLRLEIGKVYKKKRIWQNISILKNRDIALLFTHHQELFPLLYNQNLLKEVEEIYRALLQEKGNGQTLYEQLQSIKNKLLLLQQDKDKEELSALMFLAVKKGFILADYQDLQSWLGLELSSDLEETMDKIELATEEDLYKNGILPAQNKAEIRNNLYQFIKSSLKDKSILSLSV